MKYGIYLPNFGPFGNARYLSELAKEAEEAGWDGFFIWDHIASQRIDMVDPWVALAAVAYNTERIRIGTTVTPLPRRRPWKLARETVSIDHLSNGRLVLGVGIGLGEAEWGDLGEEADQKARGAMLDEALDVLTGLWSGEPFSYQGHYYQVKNAHFLPGPVQQPRIPIWVGGFWPNKAPFRRAARWDGIFPLFMNTKSDEEELAQLKEVVAFTRSQRTASGPFDVVCTGITSGVDCQEASDRVRAYEEAGATWWLEAIAPYRFGKGFEEPWPLEELRQRVIQGSPD
ncbi:MAG: LLM class flavin-dependent oxidoreductase [Omnitrophica WOR_2 bacterium]